MSDLEERVRKLEIEIEKLESEIKDLREKFEFETMSIKNVISGLELRQRSYWFDSAIKDIIEKGCMSMEELRQKYTSLGPRKERFVKYAKKFGIELLRINVRNTPQYFFYNPPEAWLKVFDRLNNHGGVDLESMEKRGEITPEERRAIVKFLNEKYKRFVSVDPFRASLKKRR
jgi:cell division protein FtsL